MFEDDIELDELMYCNKCRTHFMYRAVGRPESCDCIKINLEKPYESKEEKESKFSEMMNEIYAPLLKDKK
jgi:hypothetical protein